MGGGGHGGPNSVGYGPPDDLQSNPGSDPPPLTNVMSSLHGGDNGSETGGCGILVAMETGFVFIFVFSPLYHPLNLESNYRKKADFNGWNMPDLFMGLHK